jgi:DNA-binding response OmpR family regulator
MTSPSVLVVDDEQNVLALLEYWLTDAGYDVVACPRFDAARSYLAAHTPDALVADVRLGAFNGLQLALVAAHGRPQTALLLLSAYDDPVVRKDATACGARFLLKPVLREQLLSELAAALDGRTAPLT